MEALGEHAHPVSNLVWADRHGSIGYKTVGRLPVRRGGCPDLPKPGWTGEHEWDGWVPYDEMPEITDPDAGFVVTANNRIAPEGYPHHITSDYLDGYRARRIEQLITAQPEHDLESFEAMQTDLLSLPGLETARRLARLRPRDQREQAAIERLRSWDGRMSPESIAATIYQAFTLRLAREVTRAAIEDRDLAERWLDRADNGFVAHVTSPWRWQSHLMALWEEGDEDLVGRSWDELVLDALRGALDDLDERLGPDQEAWRWGSVHPLVFPAPARRGESPAGPDLQPPARGRRRPGDGRPGGLGSERPVHRDLGALLADGRRPGEPRALPLAGLHRAVGSPGAARTTTTCRRIGSSGRTQPMAGEGPWRTLTLEPQTGDRDEPPSPDHAHS